MWNNPMICNSPSPSSVLRGFQSGTGPIPDNLSCVRSSVSYSIFHSEHFEVHLKGVTTLKAQSSSPNAFSLSFIILPVILQRVIVWSGLQGVNGLRFRCGQCCFTTASKDNFPCPSLALQLFCIQRSYGEALLTLC